MSFLICVHEYDIQIQIMYGQSKKFFLGIIAYL